MLDTALTTLKEFFVEFMQPESRIILAFIAAGVLSSYSIPIIVQISKAKSLTSTPNHRTSHKNLTPNIGGLALFSTILVVSLSIINIAGFSFLHENTEMPSLPSILAGVTILFFIGMKDDLLGISWKKKITGEIIAMLIICVIGDQRITNMQGLLGVFELTYLVSVALTVFVGIVLINSFNLIDGIDGLASVIAIIASFTFGLSFYLSGEKEYAILCVIIIGTLIPFFYYNVWGIKNKLFMGDTGSLILGFLMTALAIRFNKVFFVPHGELSISAAAISIGILIIPIFDTLRVFTLRIRDGHSPFKADKRHIHHLLLKIGLNHIQSTMLIAGVNILFILFAFSFSSLGKTMLLIIYLVAALILVSIPLAILKRKEKRVSHKTIKAIPD
jgi:UDP-GlcNAc:undecaprenyl-phosphate/decaprenyl-phosphate GlcNAc-1-phosphate transferase